MPKIVDHDQRRREIVVAFLGLVSRDGLEHATTRNVADELGVAAGALWHYFANFDALLEAASARIIENTAERIEGVTRGRRGLDRLHATMNEMLPLSAETRDEAQVIVAFWGRLATRNLVDERFPSDTILGTAVKQSLQEAIDDGDLETTAPVNTLWHVLTSITLGQQVYEVINARSDTAEVHRGVLNAVLAPWRR